MKLLRDRDAITRFGIKNGDQLQFVRHMPVYTVAGERSDRLNKVSDEPEGSSSKSDFCRDMKNKQKPVKNEVNKGYKDFGSNKKCRARLNGRVGNSTIRLGRITLSDDENSNERRDDSCKSSTYLPNSLCDYVGGFGYPTGYCFK